MKVNRIKKCQEYLKQNAMQAMLIEDERNRQYLTYADIWEGSLLITETEAFLFVDFRYYEMACSYTKDCEVVLCSNIDDGLKKILREKKIHQLMIERTKVSVSRLPKIEVLLEKGEILQTVCADKIIKEFRKIKDSYELSCIRKAQKITDDAYEHILQVAKEGMMESEIRIALGAFMIRCGSEGFNIGYIASSGKKTAMPHGGIGDKRIQSGDLLMIDFGAIIDGYQSDCTRTFAIGYASDEQRQVYKIVQEAQKRAMAVIKPGKTGKEIDWAARAYINEQGYEGCFEHGLGHSIGLEGHENPRFNQLCEEKMQAGIVMTVEPGIYLKNRFGIRIEDMGVITENGFENFTKCSKELIVV